MKAYFKVKNNNEEIKVSTGYELGGYSYLSGQKSNRGYYIYVQPVSRGGGIESITLFEGFKQLVKEVKRQSKKAEQEAVSIAHLKMRELAEKMAREKGWELADIEPEIK